MPQSAIPKLIHFVWAGPPMPAYAARNIDEFRRLNPDYEVRVHDETALHPDYRARYAAAADGSVCGDLIRYSVLEEQGGWYFDADYWPFRPVADIERAWRLDGGRFFLARVWPDSNPNPIGNGVIACRAGDPLWPVLRRRIADTPAEGRLSYGPKLWHALCREQPERFIVAGEAWFNGVKPVHSSRLYRQILRTGQAEPVRALLAAQTGGQFPFAMHLWASKYGSELEPGGGKSQALATIGTGGRPAAVLCLTPTLPDSGSLFVRAAHGLAACGYRVDLLPYRADALDLCADVPELVLVWNGRKSFGEAVARQAKALGATVLYAENGFFDRANHVQVDHAGFLHRASWRTQLLDAPPAPARLDAFLPPEARVPMTAKTTGKVLVIGQMDGDTQLLDSEVQADQMLQRLVAAALPVGCEAFFRPHPQRPPVRGAEPLPRQAPLTVDERKHYERHKAGAGLAAALDRARFVVTINSNSIVEALAAGVPCLAFGPSLAIDAGAVRKTTIATLRDDLAALLAGWQPPQEDVDRYLQWLACRQWSKAELADPAVMRGLLAAAGCEPIDEHNQTGDTPESETSHDAKMDVDDCAAVAGLHSNAGLH